MPTTAYSVFLKNLDTTRQLLRIETRNYPANPSPHDQSAVEGLRGGCAVLVVAGFEAYLKDLFLEEIGLLASDTSVEYKKLPEKFRIHNVFESMGRALAGPKYKDSKKVDRIPDIYRASRGIVNEDIDVEAFSDTYNNPNSKTVKAIFKVVGVDDVFGAIKSDFELASAWGGPVAERFIPDKLDEIVRRRHVVAHTAQALSVARSDLRESIRFLRILASRLDKHLRQHLRAIQRHARST